MSIRELNVRAGRQSIMRIMLGPFVAALFVVSSCGVVTGSAAQNELRGVVDRDDDVAALWEGVGLLSPVDVSVAPDAPSIAVAVWTETYDGDLTLDQVTDANGCDAGCLQAVTTWAEKHLATKALPIVAEESLCGNCSAASRLSLVTVDDGDRFVPVDREELSATLGTIDTPYELMLELGQSTKVRREGDGWRAVLHRVVSDCDPFIDEYTMWSVDTRGEREQLAQYETSDNSCA